MSFEIRLLVVEDNDADRGIWERTIERYNASRKSDEDASIELTIAATLNEASQVLRSREFDAAIIDLRLDGNGQNPDDNAGNEVLAGVLAQELAVTAIFTGQPADAKIPDYAKGQVKVFTKGGDDTDGTSAVMDWLVTQLPIIRCIREASLTIRKEMASVFNRSIWPRWKFWMAETSATEKVFLSNSVARHIVSHVYESISEKLGGRAHGEEWYLLPPNPSGIRTGDLIRSSTGHIEIVVTPRCDFATNKNQTVQLAQCEDISAAWDGTCEKIKAARLNIEGLNQAGKEAEKKDAEQERGKIIGKLNDYVRHGGNKNSVHFLPRMKLTEGQSIGPLLVHFDRIRSLGKDDKDPSLTESDRRFASLSPVFLPSLVERLGGFFSRIGTPDYCHIEEGPDGAPTCTV